jgi:hypothetical protein
VSDPWSKLPIFGSLLAVLLAARLVVYWTERGFDDPQRAPRWSVALLAVVLLILVGFIVAGWLALPAVEEG